MFFRLILQLWFVCFNPTISFNFRPFGRYTCGNKLLFDFSPDGTVQVSLPSTLAVRTDYRLVDATTLAISPLALNQLSDISQQEIADVYDPLVLTLLSDQQFPVKKFPTSLLDIHYDAVADFLFIRAVSLHKYPTFYFQGLCRSPRRNAPMNFPKKLIGRWKGGTNFQIRGRSFRLIASVRVLPTGRLDAAFRIPGLDSFRVIVSFAAGTKKSLGSAEIDEGPRRTQVQFRYLANEIEILLRISESRFNKVFYAKVLAARV